METKIKDFWQKKNLKKSTQEVDFLMIAVREMLSENRYYYILLRGGWKGKDHD